MDPPTTTQKPATKPEAESRFSPQLVANTPVARNFRRDLGGNRYPWRTSLFIDNTRSTGITTLVTNEGETRIVGIGGTLDFEFGGPILGYTLMCAADQAAGVVTIYENGGLNVPD